MAITTAMAREALAELSDAELLRLSPLEQYAKPEGLGIYCPHTPFAKQQTFLDLTCKEALYGGAAGPGKTDALLMGALQYVHVPRYSALILRRDYPRLSLPGAIMDRAREWLASSDARWNSQSKTWRFPSGAVIQFGYIDSPEDRFRYASSEFQYIAWDELTEFRLAEDESNPYEFLFSRLRKTRDIPVPLRIRAASNPGNIGHTYVKKRFITDVALAALRDGEPRVFYTDEERAFVPALLRDNPFIDHDQYAANLMHLPAVTRARLLNGDWSVIEDALIRVEWLRDYLTRGEILIPLRKDGQQLGQYDRRDSKLCRRFATIDTAGTSKQNAEAKKGKTTSWSAMGVWDLITPGNGLKWLLLRDVWRDKVAFTDLVGGIREQYEKWRPGRVYIENAHFGPAVHDVLRHEMPTELLSTATKNKRGETGKPGKVERATELLLKLERGEVFLPEKDNSWRPDLEGEWLSWTGDEEETADQVDMGSYASIVCGAPVNQSAGWGPVGTGNRLRGLGYGR